MFCNVRALATDLRFKTIERNKIIYNSGKSDRLVSFNEQQTMAKPVAG